MSIHAEVKVFEQLAHDIGPGAALKFCAFFSGLGRATYIPGKPIAGHVIERVIGPEAMRLLVDAYGNSSIWVPKAELPALRRAGLVHALSKHGVPANLQAEAAGCTKRRIVQLRQSLGLEGIDASILDMDDDQAHG